MLRSGDLVPHFEVTALDGRPFTYSSIWQRRNLVLIVLPATEPEAARAYAGHTVAPVQELHTEDTSCVVTLDPLPGLQAPGLLVADRWGEIAHVAYYSSAGDLPPAGALLEWIDYVRHQCPECQGEVK